MLRSKRGFTIIELVIVAAIIGVLAAMGAVAYEKFSSRAKTKYARVYLSTAFMAERTFFAEHLSYTLCLRQIKGLPGEPTPGPGDPATRYYFVGFSNFGAPLVCGKAGNQSCLLIAFAPNPVPCACAAFAAGGSNDCAADATVTPSLASAATRTWTVTQTTFTVGATGFIGRPQADMWTIDQDKVLTNVTSGE